jgi:hypothetical protein
MVVEEEENKTDTKKEYTNLRIYITHAVLTLCPEWTGEPQYFFVYRF